jgi:hypothetical protein
MKKKDDRKYEKKSKNKFGNYPKGSTRQRTCKIEQQCTTIFSRGGAREE